jgi:hypothetical protein
MKKTGWSHPSKLTPYSSFVMSEVMLHCNVLLLTPIGNVRCNIAW